MYLLVDLEPAFLFKETNCSDLMYINVQKTTHMENHRHRQTNKA